jgi:hypothetical protein
MRIPVEAQNAWSMLTYLSCLIGPRSKFLSRSFPIYRFTEPLVLNIWVHVLYPASGSNGGTHDPKPVDSGTASEGDLLGIESRIPSAGGAGWNRGLWYTLIKLFRII